MAMASSGALPNMPDFATDSGIDPFSSGYLSSGYSTLNFSTAGDMKTHLQHLLDSKEKQLQQAGSLGQRVLSQQMELEERIRQIQEAIEEDKGVEADEQRFDEETRQRYMQLADTLLAWDEENAKLSSAFGAANKRFLNGTSHSPILRDYDQLPRDEPEPERIKPTLTGTGAGSSSSAAQSRRAKNAAHRADDVEFAFEIGSGLLTEVRRLQSLLGERDKAIQDMKEEKDDLERIVESLRTTIRQNDKMIDELRSTNWDLEVSLRDLQSNLSDSQSSVHRLESETKRLTKQLSSARDASDNYKTESEKLQVNIEEVKAKHEFEIAQARRHAAGLARDKSDLQQMVDTLKAEAVAVARRRGAGRFAESLLTPGHGGEQRDFLTPAGDGDGEDVFGTTGRASTNRRNNHLDVTSLFPSGDLSDFDNLSPDVSPLRNESNKPLFLAPNHPSNEIEALQQRLAHAQRQISTLKGSLMREKQARMKAEGVSNPTGLDQEEEEEDGEEYVDEDTTAAENEENNKKTKKTLTPFRVGRGRGRGRGVTLIQRLAAASQNDEDDEDETRLDGSRYTQQHQLEDDEVSQFFGSTSEHSRAAIELKAEQESEAPEKVREKRSPSPPKSNRTSMEGMDPAYANVLRRVPSAGSSYTGSPLRQSILGRTVGRGRRPRGGVPFKDAARPRSIVDDKVPGVLATELLGGGIEGGDGEVLKDVERPGQTSLWDEGIIEEGEDGEEYEYVRVKKVEKVEFGCQTEDLEEPVTHVYPATFVPARAAEHAVMGIQSEFEPEPALEPIPIVTKPLPTTVDMGLQTLPVSKTEAGTQYDVTTIPKLMSPVRVSSGVGTDPLPPALDSGPRGVGVGIGRGLPPIVTTVIGDYQNRRSTITQADISKSSSRGDNTVTRSFLVEGRAEYDDEDIDEGEETETGADDMTDNEYDYVDARQSIQLSTPSEMEDYHSMITMTENYSDEEDDAESIKASQFSIRDNQSTVSLQNLLARPETSTTYHSILQPIETPPPPPLLTYESVCVGADLYVPPEPVVIEKKVSVPVPVVVHQPPPPKAETREISIQTDEWKPPLIMPASPAPPKSPTLIRVGSGSHQFQFVPPLPPKSAGINGLAPTTIFTPPPTATSPLFREPSITSVAGSVGRRIAASDRRQSVDSNTSGTGTGIAVIEEPVRSRVPSSATTSILLNSDKSKPPMVTLPPPPRLPPPPSSSIMPPPNFVPERRILSDGPPPRPSSPPPPELVQRATTPLGSVLSMQGPGGKIVRIHGSSMPPSQTNIRQLPSTSSFRSAAANMFHPSTSYNGKEKEKRDRSTISLASDIGSPRSSISSEQNILPYDRSRDPSTPPNKSADDTPRAIINPNASANTVTNDSQGQPTDPAIIHAITQTMIGEFMWKYTRRALGKGVGERRHKRFFWVHPYTKTMYWSSADPGSSNVSESSAKSAYIEGVRSVLDPNPMPPGLYQYSVVVSTPHREMKITAPTKERHDIWLNALKYLLARPNNPVVTSPANNNPLPRTPSSHATDEDRRLVASPLSQRSARTPLKGETWNTTPRGKRSRSQLSVGGSVSKRSGTPAVEYMRWSGPESPYSPDRSFVDIPTQDPDDLDFELHNETMSEEVFEGLENVRACCDGRHTVGHSAGKHPHHHHHHHHQHATVSGSTAPGLSVGRRSVDNHLLDPHVTEQTRPSSPAWSFRSRTGSSHGHGDGGGSGGGGLFSWGRGDGKLRFGSRRSTKSSVPAHD